MTAVPAFVSAHQRHNVLVRHYGADHPKTRAARQELADLAAEQKIRDLLDSAPPVSDATRSKLADLLRPASD